MYKNKVKIIVPRCIVEGIKILMKRNSNVATMLSDSNDDEETFEVARTSVLYI